MSIRYILFDLDGTLLPMDQDRFLKTYFGLLATKLAAHGYDPKKLVDAVWQGTTAMIKNDGSKTNEAAFWDFFASVFGEDARKDEPIFHEFYCTDFQKVQSACGFDPRAAETLAQLKEMGFTLALATNPLFPAIATESRMRWAGLDRNDFALYTTYENSRHCKPNPDYYREVLTRLGARAEECLMVGNDVAEDMIAASLGMKVFLLTDCLINKYDADLSQFPQGSFPELMSFIRALCV